MTVNKKGLLKHTFVITVCSIVGIVFSFVLQLVIAYYFGASSQRDAYFAATAIPTYLSAIFSGSIGMIFLPKYVDVLQNEGEKKAMEFLGNTLGLTFLLTTIIVILFTVFAEPILAITAPGFDSSNQEFTKKLLIILLPTFVFQIGATLLSSILQVNHKFLLPAIAPILGVIASLIVVILLSSQIGIVSLAFGTLISSIITVLMIYSSLYKLKFNIKLKFNFNNQNVIALIVVAMPLFIGGIIFRLMPIFERMIASTLPQGSISYLGYANQLLAILATIISSGIATTFFPKMSQAFSENDMNLLKRSFGMAMTSILIVVLPVSIIFYIFGIPILHFLLERGAFTHDITLAVYSTFVFLLGAFIFQSLGNIVMRILYLSKKTIWASSIAFIEIVSYLFGGLWLCNYYSYNGLAIAQSFSTGLTILLSLIVINRLIFKIETLFYRTFFKIILSNLFFLLFLLFINYIWHNIDNILIVILKITIGLVLLNYVLFTLKVEEIVTLKNIIQVKIKSIIKN
jgi:putative peptidoglycan lipid II flippase